MSDVKYSRSDFIKKSSLACSGFVLLAPWHQRIVDQSMDLEEPLHDWALWKKHRHEVTHPCLTIKDQDLRFAKGNMDRYAWASNYAKNIERKAETYKPLLNDPSLEDLIPTTTPGDPLWTPCPACRDKGLPVHPHGLWDWDVFEANILSCTICGTNFPNADYPEDIVLETKWGLPQTLTFYGGETFKVFGFPEGRPSFTANIRSRKVQWAASYCRTLGEAYLISKNPQYAKLCKKMLLRFAKCYPNWLVHVGYGEYADMDPIMAANHIKDLPIDETTPPPNEPDRQLWTGYWSAGRASGVGLESDFIRKVVEAYDFTCMAVDKQGDSIYLDSERELIERDLLLESTKLLVADKQINNKAVSNRTAVALVGMCVGHPELVRFGLEGFSKTVNDWYLSDGSTSESPFYGLMTLGGIWDLAQAARGYSDPAGFIDSNGERLDGINLYESEKYSNVWKAFFNGLQGNLAYPAYADSFTDLKLDPSYVELMVANYPQNMEYLALLKEQCGSELSIPSGPVPHSYYEDGDERLKMLSLVLPYDLAKPICPSSFPFYYRNPILKDEVTTPLNLEDYCPPTLRIGHMRTGEHGRESLLTLSASHWGIHHENDSLNLYYWKEGQEVLSDLGYLWDNPEKPKTIRALAHNTVLIDEGNQRSKERQGDVHFFESSKHVKVMQASSHAYENASVYRRTAAIVDHGNGLNYVVDFFDVQGGKTQDYIFHLDHSEYDLIGADPVDHPSQLYDFSGTKRFEGSSPWKISWNKSPKMRCRAWVPGQQGEQVFLGHGWGQRDWKNSDEGTSIPYIVRRRMESTEQRFISIFEGGDPSRQGIVDVEYDRDTQMLKIETPKGFDYIKCQKSSDVMHVKTGKEQIELSGQFVVASVLNDTTQWTFTSDNP